MGEGCHSCGGPLKRLEFVVCGLCRATWAANPEHISTIVPRVMDEIVDNQKDAA